MTDAPNPSAPKPLTDPSDLLGLLGRFMSASFLMVLTGTLLFRHYYGPAMITGVGMLFFMGATTIMWRRLRNERLAKKAALEAGYPLNAGGSEGGAV